MYPVMVHSTAQQARIRTAVLPFCIVSPKAIRILLLILLYGVEETHLIIGSALGKHVRCKELPYRVGLMMFLLLSSPECWQGSVITSRSQ